MKQQFKTKFSRPAIYLIVLLLIFAINAYSRIIGNRGDSVFVDTPESAAATGSNIVTAAGYFLSSGSDFQSLLNRIELADINGSDYKEWAQICSNAVANMEKTVANYLLLKQRLDNTPYKPEMIDRLLSFDYDRFQKKNGLNREIFTRIKVYLGRGDVRGVFKRLLSSSRKILAALTKVKASIDAGILPELAILWRLNQDYAETMLFGQYAAEVFYEIT